jgi:hypothetical protein
VRHDLEFIYQNETDAKSPQFFLMSVDQVVDMYVKKSKLFGLDFEFFLRVRVQAIERSISPYFGDSFVYLKCLPGVR